MAKRTKKPSMSRKTSRKDEAPKLLTRSEAEAPALVVETPAPVVAETPAPVVAEAPLAVAAVTPGRTQIARLAFAKFVARGYVHGYHVEDWLAAEADLVASAR